MYFYDHFLYLGQQNQHIQSLFGKEILQLCMSYFNNDCHDSISSMILNNSFTQHKYFPTEYVDHIKILKDKTTAYTSYVLSQLCHLINFGIDFENLVPILALVIQ